MAMELHFDYDAFYPMLLDATRQALTWEKAQHADETFYAYGLYASVGWGYLVPFCCTEEELMRVAKANLGYFGASLYPGRRLDEMFLDWRFNLPASSYSSVFDNAPYSAVFKEINDLLWHRRDALEKVWDQLPEQEADAIVESEDDRFKQVCYRVLKQLDSEGLFSSGVERDSVTVIGVNGDDDLDPSRLGDAIRELNPTVVYRKYETFRQKWLALLEKREMEKRRGRSKE